MIRLKIRGGDISQDRVHGNVRSAGIERYKMKVPQTQKRAPDLIRNRPRALTVSGDLHKKVLIHSEGRQKGQLPQKLLSLFIIGRKGKNAPHEFIDRMRSGGRSR